MLVPQAKCTKKKLINHQNDNVVFWRSTLHYLTSFNVNIIISDFGIPYKGYQGNYMVQGYTHVTIDYQFRKGTMSHPHKLNLLSCIS